MEIKINGIKSQIIKLNELPVDTQYQIDTNGNIILYNPDEIKDNRLYLYYDMSFGMNLYYSFKTDSDQNIITLYPISDIDYPTDDTDYPPDVVYAISDIVLNFIDNKEVVDIKWIDRLD